MLPFLRRHLRTLVATLLAAAALTYCWTQIDWDTFFRALGATDHLLFLSFMGAFVLLMLACDALATTDILRQSLGPTNYKDVFTLRGASYLPTILNYHLGQAMFTWFLSRTHRVPVWRVAGATLLGYFSTLAALLLISLVSFVLRSETFPWLGPVLLGAGLLGALYLIALRMGGDFAGRFESSRVLSEAGIAGHVRAIVVRMPHIVVLFLGTWLPFFFFGIHVPVVDALALIPVILLVGALPLTPQGVGTREVVALHLFAEYAPGTAQEGAARITACCLSWALSFTVAEALISLAMAPGARRLTPKPVPAHRAPVPDQ